MNPSHNGQNIKSLASLSSSSMTTKRGIYRPTPVSEMRNIPIFELHGDKFVKPNIEGMSEEGQSGQDGVDCPEYVTSPPATNTPIFEFNTDDQNSDDFIIPPKIPNSILRSKLGPYSEICRRVIDEIGGLESMTNCDFDPNSIPVENNEFHEIDILVSYVNALRTQVTKLGRERTKITLKVLNENWGAIKELERGQEPVKAKRERMRRPQSRGVTGGRRRMDATEMGTLNPYVGYVPRSRIQNSSSTIGLGSASGNRDSRQLSYGDSAKKYMPRRNVPVPQYSNPPTGNSDDDGLGGFVDED